MRAILLRIGPLSGVEAELLRNAYPLARRQRRRGRGTGHRARAGAGALQYLRGRNGREPPALRRLRRLLVSGDEMLLANLELTLPEPAPEPDAEAPG
jgi:hydrogenase nickel incorporation protein HypA/HybF